MDIKCAILPDHEEPLSHHRRTCHTYISLKVLLTWILIVEGIYWTWLRCSHSQKVKWTKCSDTIYCANISVPLSYADDRQIALSVAIRPAANQTIENVDFASAIWLNPGGPGGSGVAFLHGNTTEKYYSHFNGSRSFISFDPRGVNGSTPFSCYASQDARERAKLESGGLLTSSEDAIERHHASNRLNALGCSRWSSEIGNYISSYYVAHDIRYLSHHLSGLPLHKVKIDYLGFSYGTILGMHYAALFPDNTRNMILDAVCDLDDYLDGKWFSNLDNADDVYDHFISTCEKHPDRCDLVNPRQDIENLLARVKHEPMVIWNNNTGEGSLLTYSKLKTNIFTSLYFAKDWPFISTTLGRLIRNESLSLDISHYGDEGGLATECGDSSPARHWHDPDRFENSIEYIHETVNVLTYQSEVAGEYWSSIPTNCQFYPFTPRTLSRQDSYIGDNILFTANEFDIVTPARNARKMQRQFKKSTLLHVNGSYGHGSGTMQSTCVYEKQARWLSGDRFDDLNCQIDAGSDGFESPGEYNILRLQ